MLARSAQLILFIEFAIYCAAGAAAMRFAAWSLCEAVLAAYAMALALRAGAVVLSFAIALRHMSPVPPEHRLGPAGWLKLFFLELGAYIAIYSFYMPFEPWLADNEKPLPQGRVPVLLVHGYVCNGGFMLPLKRCLEARGIGARTHDLEPVYTGIDDYADALQERIVATCAASGTDRLVVVAHSMGGLAARAYLRKYGVARVAKLVTLGTPHHGTVTARFGKGENGRQMVPGSAWLENLNRQDTGVPTVAVFSHHDNIVAPQESAMLAGAKIVHLSGIGHVAMPFARSVRAAVLEELRGISA